MKALLLVMLVSADPSLTLTNNGQINGMLSIGITPRGNTNTLERIVIYRDGVAIQTLTIPQPPIEIGLEVIHL